MWLQKRQVTNKMWLIKATGNVLSRWCLGGQWFDPRKSQNSDRLVSARVKWERMSVCDITHTH
jgi:hypothetical protein